MKILREILIILATSALTVFIISLLIKDTRYVCDSYNAFGNGSSFMDFIDSLTNILIAISTWSLGLLIFMLFKLYLKINSWLFAILLTLVSTPHFIINRFNREPVQHQNLELAICNKATDDGMVLNMNNLTNEEYQHLIEKSGNWLPMLPIPTNKIDVEYYRDGGFIGDFEIIISIPILTSKAPEIDTVAHPNWQLSDSILEYKEYQM